MGRQMHYVCEACLVPAHGPLTSLSGTFREAMRQTPSTKDCCICLGRRAKSRRTFDNDEMLETARAKCPASG